MKKSSTLIGLTVVSLATAEKVGNVSSYLVNAEKGRVDYLVIETDHEMMNSFVISTKDVLRAGNNAVMVENEDVMLDNRSVADAIKLFQKIFKLRTQIFSRIKEIILEGQAILYSRRKV